jgi:GNAT superfamily N-acetyltransferase
MAIVEWREQALLFSTDPALLDIDLIHRFLSEESYWVPGITRELVATGIANSLCFGVYSECAQIAFARVVTDYVGVGYLADVFVIAARRGQGISKRLMQFVLAHPQLQRLRRFMLATRDAHSLYAQFGFTALAAPDRFMERFDAEALLRK